MRGYSEPSAGQASDVSSMHKGELSPEHQHKAAVTTSVRWKLCVGLLLYLPGNIYIYQIYIHTLLNPYIEILYIYTIYKSVYIYFSILLYRCVCIYISINDPVIYVEVLQQNVPFGYRRHRERRAKRGLKNRYQ